MLLTENENLLLGLKVSCLGAGATLFMDLVAYLRGRFFGVRPLDYAVVGRWLGHLPRGTYVHRPITQSASISGERVIGWASHYLIGIVFAGLFVMIAMPRWFAAPTLLPALVFGLLTVAAPFLLLQPCLGAGIASSKTPRPWSARFQSAVAHLSFGFGLWIVGWAMAFAVN